MLVYFGMFEQYCINKDFTVVSDLYISHSTTYFLRQIKQLYRKTTILPVCFISIVMAKAAVNFKGL